MVIEKKVVLLLKLPLNEWKCFQVNVIVNLTDLTEGNKKKSDQYWPDEKKKLIKLENGVRLEHLNYTSYQGSYYHRQKNI